MPSTSGMSWLLTAVAVSWPTPVRENTVSVTTAPPRKLPTSTPVIVNDVWRVADGRIVERWGLVAPVPPSLPHVNGSF